MYTWALCIRGSVFACLHFLYTLMCARSCRWCWVSCYPILSCKTMLESLWHPLLFITVYFIFTSITFVLKQMYRCWGQKWGVPWGGSWSGCGVASFTGYNRIYNLWFFNILFYFFHFFINDVCDAVSKVSFHCRLLLERLRRTNQMKESACLWKLMIKSLHLELCLLRNYLRCLLTWCLKRNSSYPITGKKEVSTSPDIELMHPKNILLHSFLFECDLQSIYSQKL